MPVTPSSAPTDGLDRIRRLLLPDPSMVEKVLAVEDSWDGTIFRAERLRVGLPDGTTAEREIVRHHGGAGVVAVRDGCVCLVRQWRVALGRMTLEIPAGKLDPGEDPAACAARELSEETGLVAERLELVARVLGSPGFSTEQTSVYLAHGLSQGRAHLDEGEELSCLWLPVEDVVAAIRAGLVRDAKTVVGTLFVAGLRPARG